MPGLSHQLVFISLLATLSACAGNPMGRDTDGQAGPDQSEPAVLTEAVVNAPAVPVKSVPSADFPPEILYQLLVAEVAAQRGELGVAIANYLAAAQTSRDAGVARRATQMAVFAQAREPALEAGRLWVSLDPDNPESYQLITPIVLSEGSVDEAVAMYSHLLVLQSQREDGDVDRTYKLIGGQLARERDTEAALNTMAQLVADQPQNPSAYLAQAHVAARHSSLDLALGAVDEAMRLKPKWSDAVVMRANIFNLRGDKAGAIDTLTQAYEAGLEVDANIGLNLAKMLAEAGDMAKARVIFDSLAKQQPDNADVRYAAGILALQFGDFDQAESHLLRVLQLGQRRQEATYHLGLVYEQTNRPEQAIQFYSAVLISDYYIEAQLRAASLLARTDSLDSALSHLRSVRASDEAERVRLYLMEGELLGEAGRYEDAVTFYTRKLNELPENSSLRYSRALMAEKLDQLEQAESDLLYIIDREPENAQALNALGYTLADRTDRLDEALGYISRALEMEPNDAVILDSMGWVQYRLGNHHEALDILRQAHSLFADPEIAAHLGEVLWTLDKKQEALDVWNAALDKNPDHIAVLKVMRRFGL